MQEDATSVATYEAISLPAVHHPVEDIQDPKPQVEHPVPFREQNEVMEEDLADQRSRLDPRLAHAERVRLVDLWLE